MLVFVESGDRSIAQMVGYATHGQVHFGETESGVLFLLTENIDSCNITLFGLDIFGALDKHTTRTAAWVIKCAIEGFDKSGYQLHYIVWSVKLTILFGGIDCKRLQEILINTTYQVFFFTENLMGNLVYLVNDLLEFVGLDFHRGK